MKITAISSLSTQEARRAFPALDQLLTARRQGAGEDRALAANLARKDWPWALGSDAETLLIVLPDALEGELDALAASTLHDFNDECGTLGWKFTALTLMTAKTWVQLDAWALRRFPREVESGRFYVALCAGERFVLSWHELGPDGKEGFCCAAGACAISTGPNGPLENYPDFEAAARGELVNDWMNATDGVERQVTRYLCQVVTGDLQPKG